MFERIVVAVDGSDPSKRALAVACDLARKYDARLFLVHSPQIETAAIAIGTGVVDIPPTREEIEAAGKQVLDEATAYVVAQGLEAPRASVGLHDPATDILNLVETEKADLVVMGRRGLGSLGSLILGSVSQKVSHGAKSSCLTVA